MALLFIIGACDKTSEEPEQEIQSEQNSDAPDPEKNDPKVPDDPNEGDVGPIYIQSNSVVNSYLDAASIDVISYSPQHYADRVNITVYLHGTVHYSRNMEQHPDFVPLSEAEYALFDQIAARNNDISFEKSPFSGVVTEWPTTNGSITACISQPIQSIHITSNRDWAPNHPAGTPIDDLLEVYSPRYAEAFPNNYALLIANDPDTAFLTTEYRSIHGGIKPVVELDDTDLAIFPATFTLTGILPKRNWETETFTVEITLSDGSMFSRSCNCKFLQ